MRRQPDIFHQRLEHFLRKTRQGTMFGTLDGHADNGVAINLDAYRRLLV
jgi:hypothetical protein